MVLRAMLPFIYLGPTLFLQLSSGTTRALSFMLLRFLLLESTFSSVFLHLISEIKNAGQHFVRIQACHEDVGLLGREASVEWPLFQIKSKLVCVLGNVDICKVSFSLNLPAEALVFSSLDSIKSGSFGDLPVEVQSAISLDGAPHPCSQYDQRIYL